MPLQLAWHLANRKQQACRQRGSIERCQGGAGGAHMRKVRQFAAAAPVLLLCRGVGTGTQVTQQVNEHRLLRPDEEQGAKQDYGDDMAVRQDSHVSMIPLIN